MKLIKNKKEAWYLIFGFVGLITIIGGLILIYEIIYPPNHTNINFTFNGVLGFGFIMLSISFLIHGFHPILLFKNK